MKNLHATMARATELLAEQAKLQTAIATAKSEKAKAETEMTQAVASLAGIEALNALLPPEATPESTTTAKKRLAQARDIYESAWTRECGLQARLGQMDGKLRAVSEALQNARGQWLMEEVVSAEKAFHEALAPVRAAARKLMTAAAAMDGQYLVSLRGNLQMSIGLDIFALNNSAQMPAGGDSASLAGLIESSRQLQRRLIEQISAIESPKSAAA